MKDIFKKFIKFFLLAVIGILIILLVFGIVLSLDWPLWVSFFLLLAVIGLITGVVFIRKIWLKRREQYFIQKVIEQDKSHLKTLKGKDRDELKGLQENWKEAIDSLRRSHLREFGNPLYVLPWYLVMGESGSGKTTAINSARLSSPFVEVTRTSGISGTKNCDWWFFEQAIIIDTAGRYAIPVDEGRDKEEWRKFLNLLVKYRKKEPIHGLIITIAADKLLQSAPELLEKDGKNIRRRIDELMRILGARFPVYVLVTKCDLVQGMTRFCGNLPEKSLDQPMGIINQDMSSDIEAFMDRSFNTIGERLRNLRVLLLHKPESKTIDPGLLLFPEEFENMQDGINPFMKAVFQENPYQETPILRGIFFSSGRQEGSPFSRFLNVLGLIGEKEVLPGTSKGLFLHDFFSRILPKDRGLFAPTQQAAQWQTITRNMGLVSWIVIGIAICGLLSFSFVKNLRTLREASHEFIKPPILMGEIVPDLVTMDRFNKAILKVEDQNRNWWIPRFGLRESINVEKKLKEKYCNQFKNDFSPPLDRRIAENISDLTMNVSDEVLGRYIIYLARRINIMNDRITGKDNEFIKAKPRPFSTPLLSSVNQEIGPEAGRRFGHLYLNYIIWRRDSSEINKEMVYHQSLLKELLALKGQSPYWIVAWVNKYGSVPYMTLGDFWGADSAAGDDSVIAPEYTRQGKELIDSLFNEIKSALPDPLIFANQELEFSQRYRKETLEAWESFSIAFPKGKERLKKREEWKQTADIMATEKGPYLAFMKKITSDLEPLTAEGSLPPWIKQVYEFQSVRRKALAGTGTLAKAASKGKKVMSKIEKKFSKVTEDVTHSKLLAIEAYNEYQNALTSIKAVTASESQAYKMALQVYTEDRAVSPSPFYSAGKAAEKLNAAMEIEKQSEAVWKLVTGPFDYLWEFALTETACRLQSHWENDVLSKVKGVSGRPAVEILLGQNGYASKFAEEGPVASFITWGEKRGFHAVDIFGRAVPFNLNFFDFLREGVKARADTLTRQSYNVTIKGLPTDANPEARIKPEATHLKLQCGDSVQDISNYNFDVRKTFNWSPETCGGVVFRIDVGDIKLTKHYRGPEAFLDFLDDFGSGHRLFFPGEFPEERVPLERSGLKYIKVNYKFSGHKTLLERYRKFPKQVPGGIAICWD
jgi:type VI secretion system protein ImpL